MSDDLLDLLQARRGLVCLVGAGGKKTTLYRLARLHPGRVGITATVRIPRFPRSLPAQRLVAAPEELMARVGAAARESRQVAFACPSAKRGRLDGIPPDRVAELHAAGGFQVSYIKADGARARWIKAPDADEPCIPPQADTVIPVVSIRVVGRPLDESICHHPERLGDLIGVEPGQVLRPAHIARLLSHPQGALKQAGQARVVPVINMVDDADLAALAREAARLALAATDRFDRVVLTAMRADAPVVGVEERLGNDNLDSRGRGP